MSVYTLHAHKINIYILKKNLVAIGKLRAKRQKITFLSHLLGDEWCDKACPSSRTIKTFIQQHTRHMYAVSNNIIYYRWTY